MACHFSCRKNPFVKILLKHRVLKLKLLEINVGEDKKNTISKCNVKHAEKLDTALTPEKPEAQHSGISSEGPSQKS